MCKLKDVFAVILVPAFIILSFVEKLLDPIFLEIFYVNQGGANKDIRKKANFKYSQNASASTEIR
jgi:hypothetical protein